MNVAKKRRETIEEYHARMRRFHQAKAESDFYDTGLGASLPNAREMRHKANRAMWDNANGPSRDEYRKTDQ